MAARAPAEARLGQSESRSDEHGPEFGRARHFDSRTDRSGPPARGPRAATTSAGRNLCPPSSHPPVKVLLTSEERPKKLDLRFQPSLERPFAWSRPDVPEFSSKLPLSRCEIGPADHAIAPQHRQRVVPQLSLLAAGCKPRIDRPIPRAARSGADPRRRDRTVPAGGRHRRAHRGRGVLPPASTSPRLRRGYVRAARTLERGLTSGRGATAGRPTAGRARRPRDSERAAVRRFARRRRSPRRVAIVSSPDPQAPAGVRTRRRCVFHPPAEPLGAGHGSASLRGGEWWQLDVPPQ